MTQRRLRIEIRDIPKGMKITAEEMRKMMGGIGTWPTPERPLYFSPRLYAIMAQYLPPYLR